MMIAILFLAMGLCGVVISLTVLAGESPSGSSLVMLFLQVLFPLVGLGTIIWLSVGGRRERERSARLAGFAADNGWQYRAYMPNPVYAGLYFAVGGTQEVFDAIKTDGDPRIDVGRYRTVIGSGRSKRAIATHFATIEMDHLLPHLVLDAKANDRWFGRTNLPTEFRRDQRLSLEGDFNLAFTLSAPVGYEQDALYLFTPDVMALLMDNARHLDVEFVGNRIFLYAPNGIVTTDPADWERLFAAIDAITAKAAQWTRWRDDRLGSTHLIAQERPIGVAPQGRRLREKVDWVLIIFGALIAGFGIVSLVGDIVTWIAGLVSGR